jgi:hypothetical protein
MLNIKRLVIVALTSALTIATAQVASANDESCANSEPSQAMLDAIGKAQDAEDNFKGDDPLEGAGAEVSVYLHVIRRAPQGEGDIPVARAREITIDAMNRAYAEQGTPFRFKLAKIDYTNADDATYHLAQYSDQEKKLWDDLQVRGRRNLNIYIVGPSEVNHVTGWAEFMISPGLGLKRGDHVVLRYYPTRGGFSDPLVPVHETGHWLGLLHTFQFGCGSVAHGDLIRDTPTQKAAVYTCGAVSDTCPEESGNDPLDNFMGYAHGCQSRFTDGQKRRMKFLWKTARGGKTDDDVAVDDEVPPTEQGGCNSGSHNDGATVLILITGVVMLTKRRRTL